MIFSKKTMSRIFSIQSLEAMILKYGKTIYICFHSYCLNLLTPAHFLNTALLSRVNKLTLAKYLTVSEITVM